MKNLLQKIFTIFFCLLIVKTVALSQTENYFWFKIIMGSAEATITDCNDTMKQFNVAKTNFFSEGRYEIVISGVTPSIYWLNFGAVLPHDPLYLDEDSTIADGGVIDSLQTDTYYITFKRLPNFVFELRKVITPAILRRDIQNIFKLKLLNNKNLYNTFMELLDQYEKLLNKKEIKRAKEKLKALELQIDKTIKTIGGKKFDSEGGDWILKRDIKVLLGENKYETVFKKYKHNIPLFICY
jgi:hypothetical protein